MTSADLGAIVFDDDAPGSVIEKALAMDYASALVPLVFLPLVFVFLLRLFVLVARPFGFARLGEAATQQQRREQNGGGVIPKRRVLHAMAVPDRKLWWVVQDSNL